jgi:hypothetical protein
VPCSVCVHVCGRGAHLGVHSPAPHERGAACEEVQRKHCLQLVVGAVAGRRLQEAGGGAVKKAWRDWCPGRAGRK